MWERVTVGLAVAVVIVLAAQLLLRDRPPPVEQPPRVEPPREQLPAVDPPPPAPPRAEPAPPEAVARNELVPVPAEQRVVLRLRAIHHLSLNRPS